MSSHSERDRRWQKPWTDCFEIFTIYRIMTAYRQIGYCKRAGYSTLIKNVSVAAEKSASAEKSVHYNIYFFSDLRLKTIFNQTLMNIAYCYKKQQHVNVWKIITLHTYTYKIINVNLRCFRSITLTCRNVVMCVECFFEPFLHYCTSNFTTINIITKVTTYIR